MPEFHAQVLRTMCENSHLLCIFFKLLKSSSNLHFQPILAPKSLKIGHFGLFLALFRRFCAIFVDFLQKTVHEIGRIFGPKGPQSLVFQLFSTNIYRKQCNIHWPWPLAKPQFCHRHGRYVSAMLQHSMHHGAKHQGCCCWHIALLPMAAGT